MSKLTEDEIKQLDIVKKNKQTIIMELGEIKLAELQLEDRIDSALEFLDKLKEQENSTIKALEKKYGAGTIDTNSGEFIPA